MEGWIKLHRSIVESSLWPNEWLVMLWVWCLVKANHKDSQFMGDYVKRGQFITGRFKAANELGVDPSRWVRGMDRLEVLGCITQESNNKRTLVTICNYETYQECDDDYRTTIEQQSNNNRTQEKECKNERIDLSKDKSKAIKSPSARFSKPTIQEVSEFCTNRQNGIDPEAFIAHYESNGWRVGKNPMKDWRQAVVTWEKNKREYGNGKIRPGSQVAAVGERGL